MTTSDETESGDDWEETDNEDDGRWNGQWRRRRMKRKVTTMEEETDNEDHDGKGNGKWSHTYWYKGYRLLNEMPTIIRKQLYMDNEAIHLRDCGGYARWRNILQSKLGGAMARILKMELKKEKEEKKRIKRGANALDVIVVEDVDGDKDNYGFAEINPNEAYYI